jgi:ADP-ribose pyrophosphatase YjhB (NUDIX family)
LTELNLLPYYEYVTRLPHKTVADGVLIRDDAGRVLLVCPPHRTGWEIPGGVVEDGESPWSTALRKLHEQVTLVRPRGNLLVVDHVPAQGDGLPERLVFVFDGGTIGEAEVTDLVLGAEVDSVQLCDREQIHTHVRPVLADRVTSALNAAANGSITLCERGKPV